MKHLRNETINAVKACMSLIVITLITLSTVACKKEDGGDPAPVVVDSTKLLYPIAYSSLSARDPFILADEETKTYYLHVNNKPSFKVYSSKDMVNWRDEGSSFNAASTFWGKEDFWAPDLYKYQGKYYMFATFSGTGSKRGTSILVADSPLGPFQPLVNNAVTPSSWMCLDGSLYVDGQNQPWIVFCHEWLEVTDGQVAAQKLSSDLKTTIGDPVVLFKASDAPWTGTISSQGVTGYVTDAPFLYKAKNGELLMLWSSYTKAGKYAIGLARSESGTIAGPWTQDDQPLNDDDGGHAMIFTDFKGVLRISYHAPNTGAHPVIYQLSENNGKLSIVK
ncbi:glycoside hydrolase family 43 protein [Pararcticibacter amylolyticus]|uniref:Glycosyl hydrolase family 43 n=1 Tax=Pararcticibacter amylolyticus TaxID=2173175 RepID=A0A2U2PGT3_9SPHI|nr:glycoside hydrolase family 43 protein [Pararcticibacter amylolyticus]PWG80628.1 glycosyl hydrolase family 43 [Pararcticibacter amylolyticus]